LALAQTILCIDLWEHLPRFIMPIMSCVEKKEFSFIKHSETGEKTCSITGMLSDSISWWLGRSMGKGAKKNGWVETHFIIKIVACLF
jgi:hypothetical protein